MQSCEYKHTSNWELLLLCYSLQFFEELAFQFSLAPQMISIGDHYDIMSSTVAQYSTKVYYSLAYKISTSLSA